MERDQILKDDFPTSRRGWDPDAVRAHLETIAARLPRSDVSLADAAASQVGAIIAAAEATAAEIEQRAQQEADALVDSAREEADGIVARAREEARGRIEQAQGAVESLVSQAEDLRSRVGSLGQSLIGTGGTTTPAVAVPGPELVPEADLAASPAKAEPTPAAAVPGPELAAEPEIDPEPAVEPEPKPAAAGSASTEDLIAQLRGGGGASPPADAGSDQAAATAPQPPTDADLAAVRLVALNMAMDGAGREEIEAHITEEFGAVTGLGDLLDDVLARTGR